MNHTKKNPAIKSQILKGDIVEVIGNQGSVGEVQRIFADKTALVKIKGRGVIVAISKLKIHKNSNPIKHKKPAALKTALKVDQAKQLRAGFRATAGGAAGQTGKVQEITQRKTDKVQMVVGVVECIEYTLLDSKGKRIKGQSFRHEFTGKSCPFLTCSHDGKQLYFVGGSYRFKTDGINDI